MSTVKKMYLVDPKILKSTTTEAIKDAIKPTITDNLSERIKDLDGEMSDILHLKNLSESEKLLRYQSTLNKYLNRERQYRDREYRGYVNDPIIYNNFENRRFPNILAENDFRNESEDFFMDDDGDGRSFMSGIKSVDRDSNERDAFDDLMTTTSNIVQYSYNKPAKKLLTYLRKNLENFSVNDRQELVLNGKVIPNSNVIDLIDDAVRKKSLKNFQDYLPGRDELNAFMAKANVPYALVKNKAYHGRFKHPWENIESIVGADKYHKFGTPLGKTPYGIATSKKKKKKSAKRTLYSEERKHKKDGKTGE